MLRVVWSSIVRHTSFGFGAGFQTWALPIFAVDGDFADAGTLHPQAAEDDGSGLQQLFGDVWQWTSSAYTAYPGFRPLPGSLGEYNGKFMSGQNVLRGGSCATPAGHVRASYRNFFPPTARRQFSGLRLADRKSNTA